MEYFDNRERKLEVGQFVAFNFQGQIGHGQITEIGTRIQYRDVRPLIKVERFAPLTKYDRGTTTPAISRVTNPKNLLVIDE